MNLYLVRQTKPTVYDGFVIACKSADSALKIAKSAAGKTPFPEKTAKVMFLGTAHNLDFSCVVLGSYNAE